MNLDYYKANFPFIVKSLRNIRKNKRISHAYIVYCDNAELRWDFSKFLVKFFLCREGDVDKIPCGKCLECEKIEREIYPDLYILEPSSKSRKIKIGENSDDEDTLRWFQARFSYSSMAEASWKAGIIYDADCLVPQAQNAFLKTLEEPTKKTFFILATENPSLLLPTIRSRCQMIPILTNSCSYSIEGIDELFACLFELVVKNLTLLKAADVAERIINIFSSLLMQAEKDIGPKWTEKLKAAENLESKTARKRIKERYTAAVESQYRYLRKYFFDGIYSWFAQLYQIKSGISFDELPNPEIFKGNIDFEGITEKKAYNALKKAEEFISCFYWNINENLAIQEFCLSFIGN